MTSATPIDFQAYKNRFEDRVHAPITTLNENEEICIYEYPITMEQALQYDAATTWYLVRKSIRSN